MVLCRFFLKLRILLQCCRHQHLNRQHISKRINHRFIVYTRTSPAGSPMRLRMSVQPAPPIRLLCDYLPKIYVFSEHKIFTTLFLFANLPYLFSTHEKANCIAIFWMGYPHSLGICCCVLLFLIEFLVSRSWLCLRSMCSVHC